MTVRELAAKANLTVFAGEKGLEKEIMGGYACDLLSDVMGHADSGYVWITLQTHKNVMAIASLKELAAIVIVKGLKPDADTEKKSEEEMIPILCTPMEAFETAGIIYQLING
jgi:predicted transcriptional regulator